MFKLSEIVKDWKESGALQAHINLYGFWDEETFLTKSGDLGMVLRVKGIDYESLDHASRDHAVKRLEAALRALDSRVRVYQALLKANEPAIPHREYTNPLVKTAIDQRMAYFAAKADQLYSIDLYWIVVVLLRHREGNIRLRPAARRCSTSASPPVGSWFLPLRGHPPRKRTLALGSSHPSRPSRLSAPSRSGERNGGFKVMYQNRISLIGFTGKDAKARTTKNQTAYAVLSLATKSSYKDKKSGEYVSHTEWHRIVVWGKLGEFANTLKKGTHLLVEGELRSREYADKKNKDVQRRVWEVRADSILKLDRAEQAPPEDQLDAGPAEDEEPS